MSDASMSDDVQTPQTLAAFLAINILGGNIGLPCIILTILLSRKVLRHPIFVNFCVTWVCFATSYILLLYTGQINNMTPPPWICITQASMIYASGAMVGVSTLIFMLHIFLVVRGMIYPNKQTSRSSSSLYLYALVIFPYIVFVSLFIVGIVVSIHDQSSVYRLTFYCGVNEPSIAYIGPGIGAISAISAAGVEIWTIITLVRHWRAFRGAGDAPKNFSLVIRGMAFILTCVLAVFICLAVIMDLEGPSSDLALAFLPMSAFLLFGTQADMLEAWAFWRK